MTSTYKAIYRCRRTIVSLVAIGCLTAMAIVHAMDVSTAIAMVAGALSGANAAEAAYKERGRRGPSRSKT